MKYPRLANSYTPDNEKYYDYENDNYDNPIMCAVCGTDTTDSGWGTWCSRICFNRMGESYGSSEPSSICTVCGVYAGDSGWKDLCSRGCYYDMNELLMNYESGAVAEPDERVVAYFSANPDGGGHAFGPERIFTYIANKVSTAAEWQRLAALAPEKARSSPRKLKKWIKRKLAKQRLRAHNE